MRLFARAKRGSLQSSYLTSLRVALLLDDGQESKREGRSQNLYQSQQKGTSGRARVGRGWGVSSLTPTDCVCIDGEAISSEFMADFFAPSATSARGKIHEHGLWPRDASWRLPRDKQVALHHRPRWRGGP